MPEWPRIALSEVAELEMGQSPPGSTYNITGEGLPFIQGSAEFGTRYPTPEKWCSEPRKVAQAGDLMMSVRAPVGDLNFADQDIAIGRGLAIIRGNEATITPYLALALGHEVAELQRHSSGGMFSSITKKSLAAVRLPVPPLQVQRRIVDLMERIDLALLAASRTLDEYEGSRPLLRNQILVDTEDDAESDEVSFGAVAHFHNGGAFKKHELGDVGLPVVRIKELFDPTVPIAKYPDDDFDPRHLLTDGDLIFTWSGRLGVKFWNRGPALLNQHLFKVTTTDPAVDLAYLALALEAAIPGLEETMHGSTMKHITKKTLTNWSFTRPPLNKQRVAVERMQSFDSAMEVCRQVLDRLVATREAVLQDVMTGVHDIPDTYDRFLNEAEAA